MNTGDVHPAPKIFLSHRSVMRIIGARVGQPQPLSASQKISEGHHFSVLISEKKVTILRIDFKLIQTALFVLQSTSRVHVRR